MYKKFDKNILKAGLVMSALFTILICITVYEAANEPYLIYDLGKVIKNGHLTPIKLTLGVFLPVLFLSLTTTMFSIAYYKICVEEDAEKEESKPIKKRRRKIRKEKED